MSELPIQAVCGHRRDAPAIQIGDANFTYGQMLDSANGIAQVLRGCNTGECGVVGLLASRTLYAYLSPLAAHIAGLGYMPLNPRFPVGRLIGMLEQSGTRTLVATGVPEAALSALLDACSYSLSVLCPDFGDLHKFQALNPRHRFHGPDSCRPTPFQTVRSPGYDKIAYLLFTSGSTGKPKGVPVTHANLQSYLHNIKPELRLGAGDRCSQTFDLGFDLSVHDLFATWTSGACLCPLQESDLLNPARFIREQQLTTWFSVPALAALMGQMRTLRPGVFPSLRLSIFCGEALPVKTADDWAQAAPQSRLLNLYGPTEATIAISSFEWTSSSAPSARYGIVPIGRLLNAQAHVLIDEANEIVPGAGRGELHLSGTQLTRGYLKDPERTSQAFVALNNDPDRIWYKTGDLVERDQSDVLHFVVRIDNQIKLRGYRIELQEVDRALRLASETDLAVTLPYPSKVEVKELVGCISGSSRTVPEIIEHCGKLLPDYMVPARIVALDKMPLNPNGKIDRSAVAAAIVDK